MPKDIAGWRNPDLKDAGVRSCFRAPCQHHHARETFDPDLFRFVSWYRKHFRPDDSWKGKLVTARFQGVMTVADVYLNGKHLAQHKGGYTSFDVDLRRRYSFGADNVDRRSGGFPRAQSIVPPEGAPKFLRVSRFRRNSARCSVQCPDKLPHRACLLRYRSHSAGAAVGATSDRSQRPRTLHMVAVRVHDLDDQGKEVAAASAIAKLNAGEEKDVHPELRPYRTQALGPRPSQSLYCGSGGQRSLGATDRDATWIGIRKIDWKTAVCSSTGNRSRFVE